MPCNKFSCVKKLKGLSWRSLPSQTILSIAMRTNYKDFHFSPMRAQFEFYEIKNLNTMQCEFVQIKAVAGGELLNFTILHTYPLSANFAMDPI